MQLIMKLHGEETAHAERLRFTEATRETTYKNAERRLDVMQRTHRMYQERTEQEFAQLRPCVEEWSSQASSWQRDKDEATYERIMRERLGHSCEALPGELAEAEARIEDQRDEYRAMRKGLNSVRVSERNESRKLMKITQEFDDFRDSTDRQMGVWVDEAVEAINGEREDKDKVVQELEDVCVNRDQILQDNQELLKQLKEMHREIDGQEDVAGGLEAQPRELVEGKDRQMQKKDKRVTELEKICRLCRIC